MKNIIATLLFLMLMFPIVAIDDIIIESIV